MKTTDYGFKTTVPVPGDNLETTNSWRRIYMRSVIALSTKVVAYFAFKLLADGPNTIGPIRGRGAVSHDQLAYTRH